MTLFGFSIPLWIVLSVAFVAVYILFSILSAVRERKVKAKRKDNVKYDS